MRPGPLSSGLPQQYARRKRGEEEAIPLLRGMDDILRETYGTPIYQENVMKIGIEAFGFNSNQSDSILRKIIGKKKKDKLEMLRRICKYGKVNSEGPEGWHDNPNLPWYDENGKMGSEIKGGLANGYSEKEMDDFWNVLIGYADYCFNKSHAVCYSVISLMTAWLKYYYPVEFFASVLSIQTDQEKIEKYINICEAEKITVLVPDINVSEHNFTPDSKNKVIYYGMDAIKGVGEGIAEEIIKNRPYSSIQDIFDKLPKKVFNKRVAIALAKSGALDSFDKDANRCRIIDTIMEIRKEKGYEPLTSSYYSSIVCMEYEKEILSAYITYKPWWDTIKIKSKITEEAYILKYREQYDKNGKLMCFTDLLINACEVKAIIFSSVYKKYSSYFDENINPDKRFSVTGQKDDKGSLIIKKIENIKMVPILKPF